MTVDLRHRSVVSLLSLTARELQYLIALSAHLKAATRVGAEQPWLSGKHIALVSRERAPAEILPAFVAAARDQGIRLTPVSAADLCARPTGGPKDATKFLGRAFAAIECRGVGNEFLHELAAQAGVPVYGGLSGESDAVRVLADMLTMLEHSAKPLRNITYCYVGDGRSSLVDSLMIVGARLGMNVRICAPYSMWPDADLADMAHRLAVENGGRFLLTNDVDQGAYGVDFLYSSIWLPGSGERAAWAERVELLSRHRGNNCISHKTENRPCRFTSEVPVLGAGQATGGRESCEEFGSDGIEIIDEIFKSGCSIRPEEDRNRIHAIKAVLVATLAA